MTGRTLWFRVACPDGYLLVKQTQCLRLFTNYDAVQLMTSSNESRDEQLLKVTWYNYSTAAQVCASLNGDLADVNDGLLTSMTSYFTIWRHRSVMGDVWIASSASPATCKAIHVSIRCSATSNSITL